MTFRIETSAGEESVTFSLSGQLDAHGIAELKKLVDEHESGHRVIFDLKEVALVDRFAVRALAVFEKLGVLVVNSPTYVRDWMIHETG